MLVSRYTKLVHVYHPYRHYYHYQIITIITCILGTGGQNSKGAQLGRDPTHVPAWHVRRLEVVLLPSM